MSSHALDSRHVVQAAEDRLRARFVRDMFCEYRNGVLYLHGQLNTFYQKQMAQEVVRRMDGVATVVNQIEVVSERG